MITIIGEYHVMESQCEDDMSLNPDQYLVEYFLIIEKLDFFLEHNQIIVIKILTQLIMITNVI